jgi:hypothetical protein
MCGGEPPAISFSTTSPRPAWPFSRLRCARLPDWRIDLIEVDALVRRHAGAVASSLLIAAG